jgi:predicted N-acetyltransferase YhbS
MPVNVVKPLVGIRRGISNIMHGVLRESFMHMTISIDLLTVDDLEATNTIVMAAYNVRQSRMEALRRHLLFQPDGSFVAKDDGAIVGFGAVVDYGLFAYVGLMSVAPSMQKRGIGALILERLLAYLDERGCATVLLDASPAGKPLYDRFGFVEEDTTVVLKQTEQVPLPHNRILSSNASISMAASLFSAPGIQHCTATQAWAWDDEMFSEQNIHGADTLAIAAHCLLFVPTFDTLMIRLHTENKLD